MSRRSRLVLVALLVALAVVVLFTWVFPWVERQQQDPTVGVVVQLTRSAR